MALAPRVQRQRKRDASETLDVGVYWLHVRERREGGGLIAAAASSPPPYPLQFTTALCTLRRQFSEALFTGIFGGRMFGAAEEKGKRQ